MATNTAYYKTVLTGGGLTALDGINGTSLSNNDIAFVMAGDMSYTYKLDDSSGATESSPDIISPNAGAENKRWILQACYVQDSSLATSIHASSSKATPANVDEIGYVDTEDSNSLKKFTWSNVKSVLKAYFDTLYNNYVLETHASNHTDGTDDIQTATNATHGLMPSGVKDGYDSAVTLKHAQNTDTTLATVTANINMGSHKLTALSVPSSSGDSIRATAKITEANLEDADDKKHTQNTDTALGTMTTDIDMGTHKLKSLAVPSSNGDSIRATAKITEASLEDAYDKKHSQNTDTILGSGCVALDHGTAATDMVINVCYGTTSTPPTANTTTIGTLYVQYTP